MSWQGVLISLSVCAVLYFVCGYLIGRLHEAKSKESNDAK